MPAWQTGAITSAGGRPAALALWLLLCASPGMAQTAGDSGGAIAGTVETRDGDTVPGVQVCASGPAIMADTCVEADAGGAYRFPSLPPGSYVLTFTLPGLAPARGDSITVRLGRTTTAPFTIDIAVQGPEVRVEGDRRDLDRFVTAIGDTLTAAQLASLPGARSMGAILAATPAVLMNAPDVGGSAALNVGAFGAYGISGFNNPRVEGISVAALNQYGVTLDYGSFGDVWVGRGAYGPEWASPGVHMQMLAKQGGNRYRGSVYAAREPARWQAHNVDAAQIVSGAPSGQSVAAEDANRLDGYHDLNADIGGFIRRDRVWFYASGRDQRVAPLRVTFPVAPIETRARSLTGKITAGISGTHRLVLFAMRSVSRQPIRLDGFRLSGQTAINLSEDSTTEQLSSGLVWKVEWKGDVRGRLLFEARGGEFLGSRAESPNGGDNSARIEDVASRIVTGRNRGATGEIRRSQAIASITYPAGRHLFGAGADVQRLVSAEEWTHGYPGDLLHVVRQGVASEVYLFQTPSRSESGLWWYAGHVGDSWQVSSRLTLNLGLRFERFRAFLPAQAHPAGRFSPEATQFPAIENLIDWNVVTPRIGTSLALDAAGRTMVKGSYALYRLPPGADLGFNANPNARTWFTRYAWSDLDANGTWDPGEEGRVLERSGGTPLDALDPALSLAYVHEGTLRIEREAAAGVVVEAGLTWRGERDGSARLRAGWPFDAFTVPVPTRDPGPDGLPGSGDEGAEILLYTVPPDFDGSSATTIRNVPSDSDYTSLEVVATRALAGRWSLAGSATHTWNRDQASGYLGQGVRVNALPLTPNDVINTDRQGRHVFRTWTLKALGTYTAPWDVQVSALLRHQSGQPFGRTFLTQLERYGSVRVLAEPIGTRRQDHVTLLDLRTEKSFRLAGGRRLGGFVEVSNTFNANPAQNVDWSSGPTFLRPLAIVPPRIARVGVTLDW